MPERYSWRIKALMRTAEPAGWSSRAVGRLLGLVSGLQQGNTLEVRLRSDRSGSVEYTVSCTLDVAKDLDWVFDRTARLEETKAISGDDAPHSLHEVVPAYTMAQPDVFDLFPADPGGTTPTRVLWPVAWDQDSMALLSSLQDTRAEVRMHLAPARDLELAHVPHRLANSHQEQDPLTAQIYLGTPVEARLLVGQSGPLSPRVRAALVGRGVGLALKSLDPSSVEILDAWRGSASSLVGMAKPVGFARCLVHLPVCGEAAITCGVPTVQQLTLPVPLDDDACRTGLRLGTAITADRSSREVRLGRDDLLLHMQVMGSTGAGKSSLLAAIVQEALAAGIGVSVLDPHGTLVDRLLTEAPSCEGLTVIRSGDAASPIPINPLSGDGHELATDVLVTVLRELHDPKNQGFMGPVWERMFGVLVAAQRALLGSRANIALIPDLVSSKERVRTLIEGLRSRNPDLARDLLQTIYARKEEEYAEFTTWLVSKFQRIVGSPELRGILGTGLDHVNVSRAMDRRESLLIDLASPVIGDTSAQLLGEIWLIKHWQALSARRDRSRPHLLVVDEAHLFASGLLPRLLLQARKFGVGLVLAHQNLEQLTPSLRESVLSSTNSVAVFRTGIRETVAAEVRLGSWMGGSLTRLPRLECAMTLSDGGRLTEAFTLRVDHNERATPRTDVAERVNLRSRRLALTGDDAAPLTFGDIQRAVAPRSKDSGEPPEPGDFLADWVERRHLAEVGDPSTSN